MFTITETLLGEKKPSVGSRQRDYIDYAQVHTSFKKVCKDNPVNALLPSLQWTNCSHLCF